jgi:hypothetical protein
MRPEIVAVIGTIAGVSIGALSTLIITLINKRSEERKHYRELVVNAAIEHWKHSTELASRLGRKIYPLEVFIFQMIKFYEMILDKKIDTMEISERFAEYDAFVDRLIEYKDQRRRKSNEKNRSTI